MISYFKYDYYPFGMPMPNRNIQDANAYRYAYQGQEKDPETGKEAFELRLWDGRIGRWLTTDPKGQYHSPYLGMGNNPIRLTDPNGGHTDDDYWYNSSTGETQVVKTNDDFDRLFVDGVQTGSFLKGVLGNSFTDYSFGVNKPMNITSTFLPKTSISSKELDMSGVQEGLFLGGIGTEAFSLYLDNVFMKSGLNTNSKYLFDVDGLKAFSKFRAGTRFLSKGITVLSVALDTHAVATGEISGYRYSYRISTTGASAAAAYFAGGPVGIVVGVAGVGGEIVYDQLQDYNHPLNQAYRQVKQSTTWDNTQGAYYIMHGFGY